MVHKKAASRFTINKQLEASGWRFFAERRLPYKQTTKTLHTKPKMGS